MDPAGPSDSAPGSDAPPSRTPEDMFSEAQRAVLQRLQATSPRALTASGGVVRVTLPREVAGAMPPLRAAVHLLGQALREAWPEERRQMLNQTRQLLGTGVDVNAAGPLGQSPLWSAAYNGDCEVMRLLLAHGADVEQADETGITPLMAATIKGHLPAVRMLLEAGAAPGRCDSGPARNTSLHIAAQKAAVPIVQELVAAGAPLAARNLGGEEPLACAALGVLATEPSADADRARCVRLLATAGAPLNSADNKGNCALWGAACRGREASLAALLEAGADNNQTDSEGNTLMHAAAQCGHTGSVDVLLAAGASVTARNRHGATALFYASMYNQPAIVRKLLVAGANPNTPDAYGQSPLYAAVNDRHVEIVKALLEGGANPLGTTRTGQSLVQLARSQGERQTAELLAAAAAAPHPAPAAAAGGLASGAQQQTASSPSGTAGGQAGAGARCCAVCGATTASTGGPLKVCAGCRTVRYCSAACQTMDWSRGHKHTCRRAG